MARVLAAAGILLVFPALAWGQDVAPEPGDTSATRLGIRGSFAAPAFRFRLPPQYTMSWYGGPRIPPGMMLAARDAQLAAAMDSAMESRLHANTMLSLYGFDLQQADSVENALREKGVFGITRKAVDLTLDGTVRLELAADRLKNLRCTAASVLDPTSGCRGDINGPRIINQFNLRSGGVIGQRLRINVDWDTQRDFVNSNNIQVWYEGLEDEFVRRVEIGSVAFRPPQSRYLTSTIPTNNFGVNAVFQYGALEMQTLFATQNGSSMAERVYMVGQTTSEPQDRTQRDLDFEYGRFFWLVDPRTLPGYPAIDVLTLDTLPVPPSVRPGQVRVYRYRVPQQNTGIDPNLGGIPACAEQGPGGRSFGPVPWQLLVLGTDYYVDPSGLWIGFAARIDQRNDYIAVSYVTESGQQVGSFPAVPRPSAGTTCATVDSLRMVAEPLVGPEQPSFFHEMRQFYRVAGQDLDLSSLVVDVALNRIERPLPPSNFSTYLAALGLSVPTDPEMVDRINRIFPRVRDPGAVDVLPESFMVFPHTMPFANTAALSQPAERNDSLYRTPIYLLFTQGPPSKFQMRFRYNSLGAGDRTLLRLNALQIREGSEKLYISGRLLSRGTDYTIAYETGEVTFLNPDMLFGAGAAQVTAQFEERGLFAIAPTSILGVTGRYDLGRVGVVNVMGLYQREQSAFNRPALGFEAQANLIAGANTQLRFQPSFLSNLVANLTNGRLQAPTTLEVNGELAFTKPDPNRTGQAYLDEFEAESGIGVTLRDAAWEFGSLPQSTAGLDPAMGFGSAFEREDAVQLIWQNLVPDGRGGAAQFFPEDIDPSIQTSGQVRTPETVMFLTLHADTAGGIVQRNNTSRWSQPERPGRPRWRSMQTSLSTVGLDFSRSTFIEFWLYEDGSRPAGQADVNLVLDLGTVNEDAIALAPETMIATGSDTLYTGRQYVGLGVLNTERRPNGIFNADVDDIGILGDIPDLVTDQGVPLPRFPLCTVVLSTTVQIFPWGDLSARCTRNNGLLNTEDLDGDNTLNARGSNDNVRRYVVNLADSQYVVRKGVTDPGTGSGWRLFRIPLREPAAAIGAPNDRLVQHLRVTVAAPDQGIPDRVARFGLARFRFVGAPWVARAPTPIAGIAGSTAEPTGSVVISVISTLDSADLGYVSPPGVVAAQPSVDGSGANIGIQINEKSLRVIAIGLAQNTRGEGFLRFPAGAQRFLGYRELRVWMRGARDQAGWESGDVEGYIKVESDDNNFYMYKTRLHSVGGAEAWNPEIRVDLDKWRSLRATLETQVQQGLPPSGAEVCGGDPGAYVACDGPYIVHMLNPFANPPNLNTVQGLSTGILRVAAGISDSVEMWVDDVRLADPISDWGAAYALDARLAGGDVFDVSLVATNIDGNFRPLGAQPTFRTTSGLQTAGNIRLDRFLSPRLGLLLPITFAYSRAAVDPQLLTGSDIEGDALPGLRKPDNSALNLGFAIRRSVRGTSFVERALLDPLTFSANVSRGRNQTELSRTRTDGYSLQLVYALSTTRTTRRLGIGGLADILPGFLRNSEFGNGLAGAGYSLMPTSIRFQSGLVRDQSYFFTYVSPVNRAIDSTVIPALALQHLWRNNLGISWQPVGMLMLGADYTTVRDLRDYGDTTDLGRLATSERQSLAGLDVGVERDRNVTTLIGIAPRVASWLRPRFTTTSAFVLNRQLNSRQVVREYGDSAGAFILPQTYSSSRSNEVAVGLDYARGIRQVMGDSSTVGSLIRRFRALDFSYRVTRNSTYDLARFDPGVSYVLGLGSLEDILEQQGQLAVGASRSATTQFVTGLEFPFGLTATVNYTNGIIERFQLIGGVHRPATIRNKEWPSGTLRFSRPFSGGPVTLLTLGATLRRRTGSTDQPAQQGGLQTASFISSKSRNLVPEFALNFRNGLALIGTMSLLDQEALANGVATLLDQADVNGTASYAFPLPSFISRRRKLARSSVSVTLARAEQCLQRQTDPLCQVISDTRRQEYRGTLDTDVLSSVTAGLQLGYTVNDFRHLDRKNSQIFLVASLTLSLFAGDFR